MFGWLRFVFASMVVFSHVKPGAGAFGKIAVFGFFVLSGLLMTRVLNDVYRFDGKSFAINRFLRIVPLYIIVLLGSMLATVTIPDAFEFDSAFDPNWSNVDLISNVLIVPFQFYEEKQRFIPASWSLAVEFIIYALLWAFMARSRLAARICFVSGAAFHAIALWKGVSIDGRYFPWYGGVMPFAAGALLYFERDKIQPLVSRNPAFYARIAFYALGVVLIVQSFLGDERGVYFDLWFYASFALIVAVIAALNEIDPRRSRLDKVLGDLSYPIFLVHWLVALLIVTITLGALQPGWLLFLTSLAASVAVSFALVRLSDALIEPIRDAVRSRHQLAKTTAGQAT